MDWLEVGYHWHRTKLPQALPVYDSSSSKGRRVPERCLECERPSVPIRCVATSECLVLINPTGCISLPEATIAAICTRSHNTARVLPSLYGMYWHMYTQSRLTWWKTHPWRSVRTSKEPSKPDSGTSNILQCFLFTVHSHSHHHHHHNWNTEVGTAMLPR